MVKFATVVLAAGLVASSNATAMPVKRSLGLHRRHAKLDNIHVILKESPKGLTKRHIEERGLQPIADQYNATIHQTFPDVDDEHHDLLGKHYHMSAEHHHHDAMLLELRSNPHVLGAYVASQNYKIPVVHNEEEVGPVSAPVKHALDKRATPQMYMNQRPMYNPAKDGGMDILYAHDLPGGWGENVELFQIENEFNSKHEDLQQNIRIAGPDNPVSEIQSHATGAAGAMHADRNSFGFEGIAAYAKFTFRPLKNMDPVDALRWCLNNGKKGDIVVMIMNFDWIADRTFGPNEWFPHWADVIQAVTNKGMIFVQAAGNENQDLSGNKYDYNARVKALGKETADKYPNPMNPKNPNPGTIIVGAMNPVGDGRTTYARAEWSSYGSRLDVSAWARFIPTTTTGRPDQCNVYYGGPNACYMSNYSGTSASAAVMAGVITSVQGAVKAAGRQPLDAREFQALFRAPWVMTKQLDDQRDKANTAASHHIGDMPDLRRLIPIAIELSRIRHG